MHVSYLSYISQELYPMTLLSELISHKYFNLMTVIYLLQVIYLRQSRWIQIQYQEEWKQGWKTLDWTPVYQTISTYSHLFTLRGIFQQSLYLLVCVWDDPEKHYEMNIHQCLPKLKISRTRDSRAVEPYNRVFLELANINIRYVMQCSLQCRFWTVSLCVLLYFLLCVSSLSLDIINSRFGFSPSHQLRNISIIGNATNC